MPFRSVQQWRWRISFPAPRALRFSVGERAFVVEHDNDIKLGHGAGKDQYCVPTVVNANTMSVERVVPMAKSAQAFANETLPAGACFVPRIIQLNDTTLRCFFASEDQSGKSQSQTWYRDFDVASLTFAPDIHRGKLKTSDSTLDMQPQYFHADAAKRGFKQPAKAFGLHLLDAFKVIDGKTRTQGEARPFVSKGSNSKPTFDKFNGIHYLGWREATRITDSRGVGRNIFNIEVSHDGVNWEREYGFESADSFQYPTFRQHDGSIWCTVTQGTGGSTDRIMFGKLESSLP